MGGVRVGVGRVETASKVNCACGKARGMEEGGGGRRDREREKGEREEGERRRERGRRKGGCEVREGKEEGRV